MYKFASVEAAGQGRGRLITLGISIASMLRIPLTSLWSARPLIGMQGSCCLYAVAHIAGDKTEIKISGPDDCNANLEPFGTSLGLRHGLGCQQLEKGDGVGVEDVDVS